MFHVQIYSFLSSSWLTESRADLAGNVTPLQWEDEADAKSWAIRVQVNEGRLAKVVAAP